MSGDELLRRSEQKEAPLVITRAPQTIGLDRSPGGLRARIALPVMAILVAMSVLHFVPSAPSGFTLLAGAASAASAWTLLTVLPSVQRRRLFRVAAWNGAGSPPEGRRVRLVGAIEALAKPFQLSGTPGELVYACTTFYEADYRDPGGKLGAFPALEEVRGVPFRVRVSESTAIRVAPDLLRALDRPSPLVGQAVEHPRAHARNWQAGPITRVTLAPGDRVEVVGRLYREVALDGQSAPGRGVPLALVAGPAWGGSVWVRRLSPT